MKPKMVLIKWCDSVGITGEWEFIDDIEKMKPHICFSVGFLVDNNKDYKTLASSLNKNQVIGRITIPERSILSYKVIG